MNIVFMLAFGGGLAIAVYAMLHGVERTKANGVTRPAAYLNFPAVAALLVAFGATGYVFIRSSEFSVTAILVGSIVVGALAWFGMSILMAEWALQPSVTAAHDSAEEIQGQPAIVVAPIGPDDVGSIRYGQQGTIAPARNIVAERLDAGADVVIDRFEDGTAIVENWASVEQRL